MTAAPSPDTTPDPSSCPPWCQHDESGPMDGDALRHSALVGEWVRVLRWESPDGWRQNCIDIDRGDTFSAEQAEQLAADLQVAAGLLRS